MVKAAKDGHYSIHVQETVLHKFYSGRGVLTHTKKVTKLSDNCSCLEPLLKTLHIVALKARIKISFVGIWG